MAVFLGVALLFNTAFLVAVVHGESMLPSYHDGQLVLVRRLGLLGRAPHRGDVVVVAKSGDYIIKRLAYLPGDTIRGWQARSFWRVREFFDVSPDPAGGLTLKVPPGNYVVLGDNRAVSDDSRSFGPVRAPDILGTAVNAPPAP